MTIPAKYQIFDTPVELSDKDSERLSPYLIGWGRLHALFQSGVNETDLKRLIILEMMDRRRDAMISRLVMRLGRVQRLKLEAKIKKTVQLVPSIPFTERGPRPRRGDIL